MQINNDFKIDIKKKNIKGKIFCRIWCVSCIKKKTFGALPICKGGCTAVDLWNFYWNSRRFSTSKPRPPPFHLTVGWGCPDSYANGSAGNNKTRKDRIIFTSSDILRSPPVFKSFLFTFTCLPYHLLFFSWKSRSS